MLLVIIPALKLLLKQFDLTLPKKNKSFDALDILLILLLKPFYIRQMNKLLSQKWKALVFLLILRNNLTFGEK